MQKKRVYELAQELNISSQEVIDKLLESGYEVKSHMNSLSSEQEKLVREEFSDEKNGNFKSDRLEKKESNNSNNVLEEKESIYKKEKKQEFSKNEPSKKEYKAEKSKNKTNSNHKNSNIENKQKNAVNTNDNKTKIETAEVTKSSNSEEKTQNDDIKILEVGASITVGELAEVLGVKSSDIIMRLMKKGIMANINQSIDFETASEISEDFDVILENVDKAKEEELEFDIQEDDPSDLKSRAPIVTVMGHVDHGKTSLLDSIRSTNVTSKEAGGITQHIGASEVIVDGKKVVFLDTPGHEAFTQMRARGAKVTDIAILVVASDDGIKPQTIEAISHAKAAEVPIIVAINKIDKPTANVDKVKQELSEHGLLVEEWGGDVIAVPVSAKTGLGIENLLEMVILVAEMEELKANPNRPAMGIALEANLDKARGPVASFIVTNGTLNVGDPVLVGTAYGKIRAMLNDKGKRVKNAGPSTAVKVLGLNEVPNAGEKFVVMDSEKTAKSIGDSRKSKERAEQMQKTSKVSLDDLFERMQKGEIKELNLVLKADGQGSLEALKGSLEKLSNEEVKVSIIHSGVGGVVESDIMLASASNAIIIGFNVRPSAGAKSLIERESVDLRTYSIIYEIIEDIEKAMTGLLDPEFKEVVLGSAQVRETFKASGIGTIAGVYVTDGKIVRNAKARLIRDGVVVYDGQIGSLKRFKDDAKEVATGYECGITLENFNDIKEDDSFEVYEMQEVKR